LTIKIKSVIYLTNNRKGVAEHLREVGLKSSERCEKASVSNETARLLLWQYVMIKVFFYYPKAVSKRRRAYDKRNAKRDERSNGSRREGT
jgi:hypothetical protein